jgi:hypothetical protein
VFNHWKKQSLKWLKITREGQERALLESIARDDVEESWYWLRRLALGLMPKVDVESEEGQRKIRKTIKGFSGNRLDLLASEADKVKGGAHLQLRPIVSLMASIIESRAVNVLRSWLKKELVTHQNNWLTGIPNRFIVKNNTLKMESAILICDAQLFCAHAEIKDFFGPNTTNNLNLKRTWEQDAKILGEEWTSAGVAVYWLFLRASEISELGHLCDGLTVEIIQALVLEGWVKPEDVIECERLMKKGFEFFSEAVNFETAWSDDVREKFIVANGQTGRLPYMEINQESLGWCASRVLLSHVHLDAPQDGTQKIRRRAL